ncbi:MAG: SDR family NAD(P)-dependent oxidoreductase [Burkholderiales bacterium]
MITATVLSGKHALVTGGGRGIGYAVAQALVAHGARVSITGRDQKALDDAVKRLGADAFSVPMDVAQSQSVKDGFAVATHRHGPIGILINNAGQVSSQPFGKTDEDIWQRTLDVNLSGVFRCTQIVLPGMLASGWGRVVNIASTAGLVGYAYVAAYCASKHGVIGLTRALAKELATKPITVNAVCPGYTETDMVRQAVATIRSKTGRSEEEARAAVTASNPQGRLVQPEEVANAVMWLCLPGSESVTGQALSVSGGEVM